MLRARSLTLDSALPKIWLRFIIFYKIISLRSVFAPVEFSSKTLTSPINCCKQSQNLGRFGFVLRTAYAFFTAWGIRPHFIRASFLRRSLTTSLYTRKAGSLPRLKLRTAYAFFLTIRQADFPLKRTLPCTAQPFRLFLQEELLNGRSPRERTDRAGWCKAHKARLCELERNPRQPTTNPQPVI